MARQGSFLRNVLRASYNELPFLQRALDRYIRFVLLWRDTPGLLVVPMYDIDLMWHAHMAHSGAYQHDMMTIAGKVRPSSCTCQALAHEHAWAMYADCTRHCMYVCMHAHEACLHACLMQYMCAHVPMSVSVCLCACVCVSQQVLVHDDNLASETLSDGYMDTKAAYECKWDMLYDPPLTQKVPPGVSHPAEAAVGLPLAQLLGAPILKDLTAVREAQFAAQKVKELGTARDAYRDSIRLINKAKTLVSDMGMCPVCS